MLAWLSDHAGSLYFALAAVVGILLVAGWTTRRPRYWGYAAGALGLIFLLWLLTKFIVTDSQQIVRNLDAMAVATKQQNADALFKHISKDFRFGASDRDDVHKRIVGSIKAHKVNDIFLWNQRVTVSGDTGEVFFDFKAEGDGGTFPASAKAAFVREGGEWKIREIQFLKLGTTERQHLPGID